MSAIGRVVLHDAGMQPCSIDCPGGSWDLRVALEDLSRLSYILRGLSVIDYRCEQRGWMIDIRAAVR
jgi:hypothetical protein